MTFGGSTFAMSSVSTTAIPTTKRVDASTVEPAISHQAHLGLTVAFTTIYACVFLLIFVQLFLILYYKHRRLSGQSVFLFVCLIWSALRTTLFSFFFNDCVTANSLHYFARWFLFAFPICLQFLTLALLTLYFAKVRIV